MLKDFNPCFVLELTATPKDGSNIIVYVDAVQLKKESMVKLPVVVYNRSEQAQVIADTIDMRNRLEELAVAAREKPDDIFARLPCSKPNQKGKKTTQLLKGCAKSFFALESRRGRSQSAQQM